MKNQKSTDQFWTDETGTQIPYARTTKVERLMEKESFRIYKDAVKLNTELTAFKNRIKEICQEVHDAYMLDKGNVVTKGKGKGNFNWFNFDRSIKIEVSITDRIEFDDLGITACKDKLDEFLNGNVESKDDAVKALILDAFNNSKGSLDSKKVMNLLRYKSKIKHQLFQEAMELLEGSIRKPDSKMYFRVWAKNEEGKYENIDLNFSSLC